MKVKKLKLIPVKHKVPIRAKFWWNNPIRPLNLTHMPKSCRRYEANQNISSDLSFDRKYIENILSLCEWENPI